MWVTWQDYNAFAVVTGWGSERHLQALKGVSHMMRQLRQGLSMLYKRYDTLF